MESKSKRIEQAGLLKLYEMLLCLCIIIFPIINSLKDYYIFGLAPHIIIIIVFFVVGILLELFSKKRKQQYYASMIIMLAFAAEVAFQTYKGRPSDFGLVLSVLLYISLLRMPEGISSPKVICSFYIATIIAAIFTVKQGYVDESVSRTATMVDGSVSVIALILIFWFKEDFTVTSMYKILKAVALLAVAIVAGFGMSRARLAIMGVFSMIRLIQALSKVGKTKKFNAYIIVGAFGIAIILFFAFRLSITQKLLSEILVRFESGFQSTYRDQEVLFGWDLFMKSPIWGNGWGTIYFYNFLGRSSFYYNHSMYVAIFARGGILMAIPMFYSFYLLSKTALKSKNTFAIMALIGFFALAYGNAGVFNFTICSFTIPIVYSLNKC